jgi:hypothetical protein
MALFWMRNKIALDHIQRLCYSGSLTNQFVTIVTWMDATYPSHGLKTVVQEVFYDCPAITLYRLFIDWRPDLVAERPYTHRLCSHRIQW